MNTSKLILISVCSLIAAALVIGAGFYTDKYANGQVNLYDRHAVEEQPDKQAKRDRSELPDISYIGKSFRLFEGLKDVFDALILEVGSPSKDALMTLAHQYCDTQGFTPEGCAKFVELFNRYVDYKVALSGVEAETVNYASAAAEVERRLEHINNLQYQYFSEQELQVLFGAEQKTEAMALARYKIAQDPTLSREQKKVLIQHHFDSMSDQEKKAFLPSLQMQSLHRIKRMPTSQQHKLELVRAQFGDDAATRLATSWDKQSLFKQRVQELKEQYQDVAKENQLAWLEQHFPANDAKRARAILKQI